MLQMDESQMHYAEWQKPDSNGYLMYESTLYDILQKVKRSGGEQINSCQRLGLREELTSKGQHRKFWGNGNVL